MPTQSSQIISQLAAGVDLDKILDEHHLSFEQAFEILSTREARKHLAARRKLAAIHTHLVAHRFSFYAVHRLCELLSDPKADLRFKGAVAVLNIVGLSRFKQLTAKHAKTSAKNPHNLVIHEPTPEDAELLAVMASIIADKKNRPPEAL